RKYASNFLIPNFNANFFLTGDAQASLKSRAFGNKYDNSALLIGPGKYNHANVNANAYLVMFKMFSSFDGDTELGFSFQTKMEGKTAVTDESIALFDGIGSFPGNLYTNVFNDNFYFQSYHQMSFTYKEKISKEFTFGVKLSTLLGIQYEELKINGSQVAID